VAETKQAQPVREKLKELLDGPRIDGHLQENRKKSRKIEIITVRLKNHKNEMEDTGWLVGY
jgi:hypothetical protein